VARPSCSIELSTRADGADLPPVLVLAGGSPTAKPVELLKAEAEGDAWRVVEVFSRTGLPFDVELQWSSGGGSGVTALVTVARATRIGIHARSLRVIASNHADKVNRVGVTVADGFAATRNQWEHRGHYVRSSVPTLIPIPAFGESLRLDLADPSSPPVLIRVRDGLGAVRAAYAAANQPASGIPVGGAASVELDAPAELDFRAVYQLSL